MQDIMPKKKPLFQSKTETKGPNDSDIVDDIEESPAEPQTHHMEDDTTANNGPAEMDATANHSNEARTVVCEVNDRITGILVKSKDVEFCSIELAFIIHQVLYLTYRLGNIFYPLVCRRISWIPCTLVKFI